MGQEPAALAPAGSPPVQFGVGFAAADPSGAFARYVESGLGVNLHGLWHPGRQRVVAVRLDGTFLWYGREVRRYPLVPLIEVDVTTENTIGSFMFGPEILLPEIGARFLPFRVYGFANGGGSYFATRSRVEGSDQINQPFASTTNFDDFTWAGTAGGGLLVALSRSRRVYLDIGSRYVYNGEARYLREGSIAFDQNGDPVFSPVQSETNFWQYHVGVLLGVRRGAGASKDLPP